MSTPSSERPGAWRILFAFSSLAVLAGVAGFLAFARTGVADPAEVLEPAFDAQPLPFGFVPRFAAELPFGQKIVRFAPPGVELGARATASDAGTPAKAPNHAPGDVSGDAPGDGAPTTTPGEPERIVWRKLPIAPGGTAPREATLVFVGGMGKEAVRAYIDDPSWQSTDKLESGGGWAAVEAGTVNWDRFEPRYVIVRHFERPGTYTDSARIDLSAHGRWCVLCVDWERGTTASKEALVELASAFVPKPAPLESAAR